MPHALNPAYAGVRLRCLMPSRELRRSGLASRVLDPAAPSPALPSGGVLVVQAPKGDAFKLEDGDVLQAIDGRKPDDGAHAMRILRSYRSGEKLTLTVLRQRKPVSLSVTMPDRPEMDNMMWESAVPAMPHMPSKSADSKR